MFTKCCFVPDLIGKYFIIVVSDKHAHSASYAYTLLEVLFRNRNDDFFMHDLLLHYKKDTLLPHTSGILIIIFYVKCVQTTVHKPKNG